MQGAFSILDSGQEESADTPWNCESALWQGNEGEAMPVFIIDQPAKAF
ncbi:hypothetical protein [Paenibacillus solani]